MEDRFINHMLRINMKALCYINCTNERKKKKKEQAAVTMIRECCVNGSNLI